MTTYVQYGKEDLRTIYARHHLPAPHFWHCPCGCKSLFAYARDARALWVMPGLAEDDDPLRIVGLVSCAEITLLCDMIEEVAKEHGGELGDVPRLRRLLASAFALAAA